MTASLSILQVSDAGPKIPSTDPAAPARTKSRADSRSPSETNASEPFKFAGATAHIRCTSRLSNPATLIHPAAVARMSRAVSRERFLGLKPVSGGTRRLPWNMPRRPADNAQKRQITEATSCGHRERPLTSAGPARPMSGLHSHRSTPAQLPGQCFPVSVLDEGLSPTASARFSSHTISRFREGKFRYAQSAP
jgi:hypothetical protein